ncbi:MAG TPA: DUF6316 family protein [Pseudomonadales bacterium]|nr:DUF6316 family protein [Pseudomonadales bacterium]HNI38122.1 DUF6316 family protein [Pseudomonadales bacterium]HNL91943.1 DUF6316 family protein [Pseudomonadales bacterium]HNN86180.1 DUF6316 family protein [Pseudomonadales bacterium]
MKNKKTADHCRKGEQGLPPERRSRTFFSGDGWYFLTREHIDVGPFDTQELAEIGVQDYIGFSQDVEHIPAGPVMPVPDESEENVEEDGLS